MKEHIKPCICKTCLEARNQPYLDISSWLAIGVKYNFWKFFLDKWLPKEYDYPTHMSSKRMFDEGNGFEKCRSLFIEAAKKDGIDIG